MEKEQKMISSDVHVLHNTTVFIYQSPQCLLEAYSVQYFKEMSIMPCCLVMASVAQWLVGFPQQWRLDWAVVAVVELYRHGAICSPPPPWLTCHSVTRQHYWFTPLHPLLCVWMATIWSVNLNNGLAHSSCHCVPERSWNGYDKAHIIDCTLYSGSQ